MTSPPVSCRQCGVILHAEETRGLCPACLLETSLRVEDQPETPGPIDQAFLQRHHLDPAPTPPADALAPQPFGDYDLFEEIGRGGMGVIFRARHRRLNRVVALKMVLAGPLASRDFTQRFETEARAAAGLDHPNIVPIYEVGECQGQQYYTMRLVEGPNLAERLQQSGPPDPRQAALWLRAVARAVHYAHQRGVLHRDLKPANILLDTDGEPHVTDFGLAKLMEEESGLTLSQAALGTPNYMSPEQAAGKVKDLTVAADVYSLGAILWESLTGQRLFEGPSPLATISQVMDKEPARPSLLNPAVPRDLDTICLRCLQKEPGRRYESALDLAEDLEHWAADEPIKARQVGWAERLWLWCRRRPALAGLAGSSLAVLLAVSAVAIWRIQAARQQEQLERYAANISLADKAIQTGSMDRALDYLLQCPEPLRHWEWGRLLFECLEEVSSIPAHTTRPRWLMQSLIDDMAFDAQGRRLATQGLDGTLAVFEPIEGRELFRLGDPSNRVTGFAFRPGQGQIAVGHLDGSLDLWETDSGGRTRRVIQPNPESLHQPPDPVVALDMDVYDWEPIRDPIQRRPWAITGLAWDAAGERLAVVRADGRVTVGPLETPESAWQWSPEEPTPGVKAWFAPTQTNVVIQTPGLAQRFEATTGRLLDTLRWGTAEVASAAATVSTTEVESGAATVSPDGARVILINDSWQATLRNQLGLVADLGTLLIRSKNAPLAAFFSPDGSLLCIAEGAGATRVYRANTGELVFAIPYAVYGGAFSARGDQLAVFGAERVVHVWDVRHRLEIRPLRGHLSTLIKVTYDPTGRLLASSSRDGMVKVWSATLSGEVLFGDTLATGSGYSPDGRWLATGPAWRGCEFWEARTGRLRWSLPTRTQLPYTFAFSPDSQLLYVAGSDRCVRIHHVSDGRPAGMLRGHERAALVVDTSADGRFVATGDLGGTVKIWEASTRRERHSLAKAHPSLVWSVQFDPTSRWLVTAGTGPPRFWDVNSGQLISELDEEGTGTYMAAFSPDGRKVVAACLDKRIRVWEVPQGRLIQSWPSQTLGVSRVSHSPDGLRFAVSVADMSTFGFSVPKVEVWDVESGRPLLSREMHQEAIYTTVFDAQGTRLTTASMDTTVRQWEAFPQRDQDYPDPIGSPLADRVRHFAREYWRNRVEQTSGVSEPATVPERPALPPGIPVWEQDRWPQRDPQAGPQQINLDRYYTGVLDACFYPNWSEPEFDDDLADLPPGLHTLAGVPFDIRGVVWLLPRFPYPGDTLFRATCYDYPQRVDGIAVARKYRKLHVLHAAQSYRDMGPGPLQVATGPPVAVAGYVLHYADGTQHEHEVVYGRDLRNWWWGSGGDEAAEADHATAAWVGDNPIARQYEAKVRLFLSTFINPRPNVEVVGIDFVSKLSPVAPFLVAMTVEE